jgi:hypothetical protein
VSVLDHLRHPGWPRRALFGLGLLLALIVIIRLVLDPIAAHFTHKQLNASEAVSGDFESVHVTLLPPGYGGDPRVLGVIPIQGRLDQPDIQIWPTILGVVRNAFVEGISAGFALSGGARSSGNRRPRSRDRSKAGT